jgi:chemotaxis signal transduction protein
MSHALNLPTMLVPELTAPTSSDAVASLHCVFRAGEDYWAVPLLQVAEIVSAPQITEIPASPPFLLGTVMLGNDALPVIDLALSPVLPDPRYAIVIHIGLGDAQMRVAIAADDLIAPGAATVPEDALQYHATPGMARFIQGRLNCNGVTAWALDPNHLINALLPATRD